MIQGIIGNLSSCKTLTLTYLGWYLHTEFKAKLFSNYHLKGLPFTYIRTFDDFKAMRNGVLLADELWFWLDSYKSMDRSAQVMIKILMEAGKNGVDIIWTAQHSAQVHPRLYRITSEFILPVKHLARDRKGNLLLLNGKPFPLTCDVYFADLYLQPTDVLTFDCTKVFPLYDTREKIRPLEGLEKFKAAKALKDIRALAKAKELGIDLNES